MTRDVIETATPVAHGAPAPAVPGLRPAPGVPTPSGLPGADGAPAAPRDPAAPLREDLLEVNIGPSHPAMHGTFRIKAWLDGETIVYAVPEIGYLHRCFEKMGETHPYVQVIPYTDRLNYLSPFLNNVGYCLTIEKLLGIEIPVRAQLVRVILGELSRIMDHLVCIGTNLVDLGALTNFWYMFQGREEIYTVTERVSGSRMMVSYARPGGLMRDTYSGFEDDVRALVRSLPRYIDDVDRLITANRIFIDRTRGVSAISAADAIDWGWTGPCLRATGVPYDLRKVAPYHGYDTFDFEVPVGRDGDVYDRYLVRMEEMRQSLRIVAQAVERLEPGPVIVDDPRVAFPPKDQVYNTIEGMVNHFKLTFEGLKPPAGEVYGYTEGANGELGFYVVSDGTGRPYRMHCRGPCFAIYQNIGKLLEGRLISDIVAIIGSLNIVAGELER